MANYTMRADGTAANKADAVDGDPAVVAECMNASVHNGQSFSPGDIITISDQGGTYELQTISISPPSSGIRTITNGY